jgi:hypothetical protein
LRVALVFLALAILAAPLVWRFSEGLVDTAAPPTDGDLVTLPARVRFLEDEIAALRERLAMLEQESADALSDIILPPPDTDFGGLDEPMLLAARSEINVGRSLIPTQTLVETFGMPAPELDQQCREPTSPRLLEALEIRDVGPFRARMVRPALDSLERIMAKVRAEHPQLYGLLKTYGGFCVRLVRGSEDSISRHAFGVAIDVSIGGTLDEMGDGHTQFGLIILHDYFAAEGWFWGAAFSREDSMHFEVSRELFDEWREAGLL